MATERATTAPTTGTATQETNANFNLKSCLNDLTKISQNEFEAQFRNWMEKDGVARSMQAKLRADLIRNFNKTNLGKHMLGQTTTNRLTLAPMELALNTLIAEFLFSQDCHFTLSVYSTEAPFRNTIPDLEGSTHFRFQQNEIIEIIKAICGTTNFDWNFKNRIVKDYESNKKVSLLYFILKALLDSNAETRQQKITVGTNTRPFKMPMSNVPPLSSDGGSSKILHDSKTEFYNTNFRCLNRYLIILSRRVKEMSENFERLQNKRSSNSVPHQPRVRVFKSPGRRKFEDLNRSLERVTENLRQMANAKRKSKRVSTIVKAIETLSNQFQKCAENFENVSKDIRLSARSSSVHVTKVNKSTSAESIKLNGSIHHHINSPTTAAASQTDLYAEKTFGDWLHEMRYTRNGQKFLDRVEKSFLKALEKQKRELAAENEIKLKHQRELLRIRYKQKVIEQMYTQSSQSANTKETASANIEPTETISEQFRQFELKHFDLLSKIYESENENRTSGNIIKEPAQRTENSEKLVHFNVKENEPQPRNRFEMETVDLKLTSSSEYVEQPQPQQSRQVLKEISTNDIQQQVKEAIVELISEERNVDQIVLDAKIRIKELEHESNQLTENFLGYLDRQRQQKLAAREAAQSLWNDYMYEREKMQKRYSSRDHFHDDGDDEEYMLADIGQKNQIKEHAKGDMRKTSNQREKLSEASNKIQKISNTNQVQRNNTSSDDSSSSSYLRFKNPITQAKQDFFERERKFKTEAEELLRNQKPNIKLNLDEFLSLDNIDEFNMPTTTTSTIYPIELTYEQQSLMPVLNRKPQILITNSLMAQFLSDSVSGTNTDLSTPNQAIERTTEMSATTSNFQLAANWQSSLERPQNGSVNKSQRREIIAATATASATAESIVTAKEEIKRMKIQKPTTITTNTFVATTKTKTTIPTTSLFNNKKNKTNGGATIAEEQQVYSNNYKIKSDAVTTTISASAPAQCYGQRNIIAKEQQHQQEQRQSEWDMSNKNNNNNSNGNGNGNKTSNIKSNVLAELRAFVNERTFSTAQTSKPSSSSNPEVNGASEGEPSRKAVLKQTMARMQQLFLSHQQPIQKQQQIILSDVAEELTNDDDDDDDEDEDENGDVHNDDDIDESESAFTKVQKTKTSEIKESQNKSNNNNNNKQTTSTNSQDVGGGGDASNENVIGHYKNNLQLTKQIITKWPTKDQQQQQQDTIKIPTTTIPMRNINEQKEATTSTFTTTTTTAPAAVSQTTKTTLHSIEGNKTVEASNDWQQIACGLSGRPNKVKVNVAAEVKEAVENVTSLGKENVDNDDDDDDDDFEKDIKNPVYTVNTVNEPGEIIEINQTLPVSLNQLELGELIECSDDVSIGMPEPSATESSVSAVSSIDLQLSVGGGANRRRNSYSRRAGVSVGKGNGSDSGSDFWA